MTLNHSNFVSLYFTDGHTVESPIIRFTAGAIAGSIACAACYPLDLVKTRLIVDSHGKYRGILGALTTILKNDGIQGLYKGLTASLCVVVPTLALSYSAYGTIKSAALKSEHPFLSQQVDGRETITMAGGLLCGSLSGVISSSFTFPADLVRRQLQVQGFNFQNPSSTTSNVADVQSTFSLQQQQKVGSFRIAQDIYRSAGIRGFFRGFFPELLKVRTRMWR